MMRQKQRKAIEDVYGSKFDTAKSQVTTHHHTPHKIGRATERDYGYIINSTTPYNGGGAHTSAHGCSGVSKSANPGKETSRRKSARPTNKFPNEKHSVKETHHLMQEGRRSPAQIPKGEKIRHISPPLPNVYDTKTYGDYNGAGTDNVQQQHHQHHQNHHRHQNQHNHHNDNDDDKDDDTDEFFDMIRRTVDSAIGKSISELLNRNFRELSSKVDRFSAELKNTNALLNHMQVELNNKVAHYGEENSRHFRYLCMKSEYDKMFYQHQTMIAAAPPPKGNTTPPEMKKPIKRKNSPKPCKSAPKLQREAEKVNVTDACPCRSSKCQSPSSEFKEPLKIPSAEVSQKTSEVGMREVLEHIQKFCNQMQFNDTKCDLNSEVAAPSQQRNIMRPEDLIKINKRIFAVEDDGDEEDEDWEGSSDGMTPRNRANDPHKYGGNTSRGGITQRGNNGAGDG